MKIPTPSEALAQSNARIDEDVTRELEAIVARLAEYTGETVTITAVQRALHPKAVAEVSKRLLAAGWCAAWKPAKAQRDEPSWSISAATPTYPPHRPDPS